MATLRIKQAIIAIASMAYANANLTIYCYVNKTPSDQRHGGLTTYQKCSQNKCTCFLYEHLCLERDVRKKAVVLKSMSISEAKKCNSCICNEDEKSWALSQFLPGYNSALPNTPRIPLPQYEKYIEAVDKAENNSYTRNLFKSISQQRPRKDPVVVQYQNEKSYGPYEPYFTSKPEIGSPGQYCIDGKKITCDLHYDTDWDYRVRGQFTCDEAFAGDICFSTHACFCSNGYF